MRSRKDGLEAALLSLETQLAYLHNLKELGMADEDEGWQTRVNELKSQIESLNAILNPWVPGSAANFKR